MKTFLEEIQELSNEKELEIEEIKLKQGAVVLFGAGIYAIEVEKFLNSKGIKVDAFFVDEGYENSKSNVVDNVLNFENVLKRFDKINIITANIRKKFEYNNCKQVLKEYTFDCLFLERFSHFNYDYICRNRYEFETVYNNLCDEQSKIAYIGYIKTKITHNSKFLINYCKDQYFCDDILEISEDEVFVDGGAYTGDTLLLFIKKSNNKFKKYYAFEPDIENFSKLKSVAISKNDSRIITVNKGLWSDSSVLKFSGSGTDSGLVTEYGEIDIVVDSIDNLCPEASFIVMDVEGSELKALKGASKTIIKNKPKLGICIYHRPEDLIEIPTYLKSICPEYRFYVRQHWLGISRELVLYAIT